MTRVSNLLPFCRGIQMDIQSISSQTIRSVDASNPKPGPNAIGDILQKINRKLGRLKRSLKKKGLSPSRLPLPSYRAYLWLSFLADENHLKMHITAQMEFSQLADDVLRTSAMLNRLRGHQLDLKIFCMPYIYQIKIHLRQVEISIHEAMITAPREIKKDLLLAALAGNKAALRNLRKYCSSSGYYQTENLIRGSHKGQGSSPTGQFIDLVEVFERVNHEYFQGGLNQPQLTWSQKRSYRRLGTYSAQLDLVTISRALDHADYPTYAIDFIMYHELLHKKMGVQRANSGKRNHTKLFKDLEKRYKFFEQANEFIKTLAPSRKKRFFGIRIT
jgi:hypothetical protein